MIVRIYQPDAGDPYTSRGVDMATAETHIAASDRLSTEASVLLAFAAADEVPATIDGWSLVGSAPNHDGSGTDSFVYHNGGAA